MHSHERTCIDRRGVPSGPQHSGTTLLVIPNTDKMQGMGLLGRGRWIEGGKRRRGERSVAQVRLVTGGERNGAHMLPFMVLICSVNLGFCCFPPECRCTRSQSGSSSIFATTAHKLVPKLLMENETGRKMSSVAVWEYILSSHFPLIDGVRMHFNKTVKQIQGET